LRPWVLEPFCDRNVERSNGNRSQGKGTQYQCILADEKRRFLADCILNLRFGIERNGRR
jgi:hypothetical protein